MNAIAKFAKRSGIMCTLGLSLVGCSPSPQTPASAHHTGGSPPSSAGGESNQCSDFELDVERFWSTAQRTKIKTAFVQVTTESESVTVERVVTKMDRIARDWVMMQESVCKDTLVRRVTSPEVYSRISSCLRAALLSQRTLVEGFSAPTKELVFRAEDALVRVSRDLSSCQEKAVYSTFSKGAEEPQAEQLLAEAKTYDDLGQVAKLQETLTKGIAVARNGKKDAVLVELLLLEANCARKYDAQFARAIAAADEARALASRAGNKLGEMHALAELGYTQSSDKKNMEAVATLKAARDGIIATTGPNSLDLVRIELALSDIALELMNYVDGEKHAQMAVKIAEATAGTDSEEFALGLLAFVELKRLTDVRAAEDFARRSVAIFEKKYGARHPKGAEAYMSLSFVLAMRSQFTEAEEAAKKAVAILEDSYGSRALETANAYGTLGTVLGMAYQQREAVRWRRKAMETRERINPRLAAYSYVRLALSLAAAHEGEEALAMAAKGLETVRAVFGENSRYMPDAYSAMSQAYQETKNTTQALVEAKKALASAIRVWGPDSRPTASFYVNTGVIYTDLDQFEEAIALQKKALIVFTRIEGENSADVCVALSNIGDNYRRAGNMVEARSVLERAVVLCEKAVGPTNALALSAKKYLRWVSK